MITYIVGTAIIMVICTYSFKYTLYQLEKSNAFEINTIIPTFVFHAFLEVILISSLLIYCIIMAETRNRTKEDIEQIKFPEAEVSAPKDIGIHNVADMQKFNNNPDHVDFEIIGDDK